MEKGSKKKLIIGIVSLIILIIVIIVFFVDSSKPEENIKANQFISDLQEDVNEMLILLADSREVIYSLPVEINSVCFVDNEYENIAFRSKSRVKGGQIKNLDIKKMLGEVNVFGNRNIFCINTVGGKVKIKIQKNYGDILVCIGDNCESELSNVLNEACQKAETENLCDRLKSIIKCCEIYSLCC